MTGCGQQADHSPWTTLRVAHIPTGTTATLNNTNTTTQTKTPPTNPGRFTTDAQREGDHRQHAPHTERTVAGLGAEERARDRRRREHGARTSPQTRERALLLGQRVGGQLETELLDRFSHANGCTDRRGRLLPRRDPPRAPAPRAAAHRRRALRHPHHARSCAGTRQPRARLAPSSEGTHGHRRFQRPRFKQGSSSRPNRTVFEPRDGRGDRAAARDVVPHCARQAIRGATAARRLTRQRWDRSRPQISAALPTTPAGRESV